MKKIWIFRRKNIKGYWCGWYESGKRKAKAFPNKLLAEHFRQIKYAQLNSDVFVGTINVDWQQMVQEYEQSKQVAGHQETSIYEALLTLRHFERIAGPLSSKQISQTSVDRFILQRQQEVKRYTANKDISNIKAFINWMVENHYIVPGLKLKKLKVDPCIPRALTLSQTDHLLNAAQQESATWYVRILLALITGLRGNDIERLQITDINFETNTIHTYSKKTRKQMLERPLPADIMPILIDYVNNLPTGQIKLLDDLSGKKSEKPKRLAWERIRKRADLPNTRFKDLRSTFSSELQKQGVSLAITQQLLEHSSPATTERYYTQVDSALAAAVNRLPIKKWLGN